VLGQIGIDVAIVCFEPSEITDGLCFQFLETQYIGLLFFDEGANDVISWAPLFLAVLEFTGHGLDSVYVKADDTHLQNGVCAILDRQRHFNFFMLC